MYIPSEQSRGAYVPILKAHWPKASMASAGNGFHIFTRDGPSHERFRNGFDPAPTYSSSATMALWLEVMIAIRPNGCSETWNDASTSRLRLRRNLMLLVLTA